MRRSWSPAAPASSAPPTCATGSSTHPDDTVRVLDKLTYAGRRENLEGLDALRAGRRRHRRPRRGRRRRSRAATRSSTSPPSRTSTARSSRRASSSRPTSSAPTCCSRRRATRASGTSRSRPTRSTARSRRARSPRRSPLDPSSPYSASKAGGDLIVGAFHHTYGAEALIVRASNNYGPRQYPEKLIPLCILNALAGDPLPVYGDGMQVRNWLYVDDFAARDRPRARARRAGRGLQRRRPRRAAEHRGRARGSSSSPAATSR